MTQKELADFLGYSSPQFVSNWERDLALPPLKVLGKITELLDLDSKTILEAILEDQRHEIASALGLRCGTGSCKK